MCGRNRFLPAETQPWLGFGYTWVRFRLAVRSNASVQVIRTFLLSDVTDAVFRRTQLQCIYGRCVHQFVSCCTNDNKLIREFTDSDSSSRLARVCLYMYSLNSAYRNLQRLRAVCAATARLLFTVCYGLVHNDWNVMFFDNLEAFNNNSTGIHYWLTEYLLTIGMYDSTISTGARFGWTLGWIPYLPEPRPKSCTSPISIS